MARSKAKIDFKSYGIGAAIGAVILLAAGVFLPEKFNPITLVKGLIKQPEPPVIPDSLDD